MMSIRTYRGLAAFCLMISLAAAAAAGLGVFSRGDGTTAPAVSIRGEEYEYVTNGVYAYNAERIVAEGVGWDAVTLFFAVPLLLVALPGVARGSLKSRLLATGVLGYFFYQYLMYAVFWALGPLFPVFVGLYAASAVAIVWTVSTIDIATLPERFSPNMPRRTMAAYSAVMAVQLIAMWTQRIAVGLNGDMAGASMFGMPTLSVQALDLGIIVPLAIATAVLLWRGRPWGYLLGSVFAIKGVTMAGAICAMLISAAITEGSLETGMFAVFGTATLAAAVLAYLIYRGIDSASADALTAGA